MRLAILGLFVILLCNHILQGCKFTELSTLKMKSLPQLQHCSRKTKKLVMKKGAFIWFKYYIMLILCNLKQQLYLEYFKSNLSISILELKRNFAKL